MDTYNKNEPEMMAGERQVFGSRFYRQLEELQPYFFYVRRFGGDFVEVHPNVTNALGYAPEEFKAHWKEYLVGDETRDERLHRFVHCSEEMASKSYTVAFRRKDGEPCSLEISEVWCEGDGLETLRIEGVACDVTHQKIAEDMMRFSERRFREISESSPVGVFQTDRRDRFIFINSCLQSIIGRTLRDILGRPWWEFIHPDDRQAVIQCRSEAENQEFSIECRLLRPDGEIHWVAMKQKCVFSDDETTTIGIVEEITERKQAAGKLKNFAEELKRSNEALNDFASIASHDLQEPLRKVTVFGDRLRERLGSSLDEKADDYHSRMQNAAGRMQSLIDDLLEYSRVMTKARSFRPINLAKVVDGVLSDLEIRIKKSNGRVEVGDLPSVEADEFQMRQLFQNLIGNALKFHKENEPPRVSVTSRKLDNGCWEFVVEDNGIGFDCANLERIFKPFERLHGRSAYEGSGIGLAICKKIVERHKGTITARSAPQEGTSFCMILPEKQPAKEETES